VCAKDRLYGLEVSKDPISGTPTGMVIHDIGKMVPNLD
jgi:hypothetical protein